MADTTQQALQQARQTIIDLRTVLDPFDTPAKVVWASSAHTLQAIDAALSLPVEASGDVKLPAELDAATLWLAEARDSLRKLADGANQHLTAVLHAALATPSAGIAGDAAYPMRDGYAGSTFISNASGHSLRIEYKTREQGDAAQAWLAGDAAPQEQPQKDTVREISQAIASMMVSRTEIVDGLGDVHGYKIKTGALHRIIGLLSAAGHPVPIARTPNVTTELPSLPVFARPFAAPAQTFHLASGDKESVREQAVAWMLYEHDDGRLAVAPTPEAATFARGDPAWHRVGSIDVYASPLPAVQTVRTVRMLTDQQVRELMRIAHQWAGPDHADTRSDSLELALRALSHQAHQKEGA